MYLLWERDQQGHQLHITWREKALACSWSIERNSLERRSVEVD
jgi:hypothetical protein